MYRCRTLLPLLALLLPSPVSGQDWAAKMFETTSHDFGPVARGARAEHEFVLVNPYEEDAQVASVRSSCSCTGATVRTPVLKSFQKGAIVATLDTRAFHGPRTATITVTFSKPFPAEVQLHVQGFIRPDVVLTPESAVLGTIEQGTTTERTLSVSYAGRHDWQIRAVKSDNPHLTARAVETGRGNGRVTYSLVVRLAGTAPAGPLADQLRLATDDAQNGEIPVAVSATIQPSIVASPASLFMGILQFGQKATRQIVVKGKKPFSITKVRCDGGDFQFDVAAATGPKELHLIPVTFVAGRQPGKVAKVIHIETDAAQGATVVQAHAVIADATAAVGR